MRLLVQRPVFAASDSHKDGPPEAYEYRVVTLRDPDDHLTSEPSVMLTPDEHVVWALP